MSISIVYSLCDRFQAIDKTEEGGDGLFLSLPISEDDGVSKPLLASHDEEMGTAPPFDEMYLFSQRFDADILRQGHPRFAEVFSQPDREPLRLVAEMNEREAQLRGLRLCRDCARTRYLEHRANRTHRGTEREVAGGNVIARSPRNAPPAENELETGIAPGGAATDEIAGELVRRLGHFQIFKKVFKAPAARIREMLGGRREIFCALARHREFCGKKNVVFGAGDALFGERRRALLEKIRKFAHITCTGLFVAHRIDADDRIFVEEVVYKRDERADDDRVRERAVGAERVELDDRFLRRGAARRNIGVPNKERLAGVRRAVDMLELLQEACDDLGNGVERKMSERLGVVRRLLRSASARPRGQGRERHEAVILADRTRFMQKFFRWNDIAHHGVDGTGAIIASSVVYDIVPGKKPLFVIGRRRRSARPMMSFFDR